MQMLMPMLMRVFAGNKIAPLINTIWIYTSRRPDESEIERERARARSPRFMLPGSLTPNLSAQLLSLVCANGIPTNKLQVFAR